MFALIPLPALAVQSATLGAYPTGLLGSPTPWFQFQLARGAGTTGSFTVDNRADQPQSVRLYSVDAAPTGDGGFGMAPEGNQASDAGSWVHLTAHSLELPAHTTQTVSFTFTVPQNASVGPHYAGIIVQPNPPPLRSHAAVGVQVIARLGMRLYLTVPGTQHPGLAITSLAPQTNAGNITLQARLHDTGNTIVTPHGRLVIGSFLAHRQHIIFNAGTALRPGTWLTTTIPTGLFNQGLPRLYWARLTLVYGPGTATRTTVFWTGHLLVWLAGAGTVALVLLMMAFQYARTQQPSRHDRQRYQGQPEQSELVDP